MQGIQPYHQRQVLGFGIWTALTVIRGRERQLQVPAPFPDFQVRQDIMGAAHPGFRGVTEPARAFRPNAPGAEP